ncbi:MAG: hypothetical protein AAF614_37885 [Chloroflexota bacterium]
MSRLRRLSRVLLYLLAAVGLLAIVGLALVFVAEGSSFHGEGTQDNYGYDERGHGGHEHPGGGYDDYGYGEPRPFDGGFGSFGLVNELVQTAVSLILIILGFMLWRQGRTRDDAPPQKEPAATGG